jgi:hypothetical protein
MRSEAPVLSSGVEGPFSMDDPAARVLADYGLLEATESGLLPRPGFVEAFGGRERALADGIRSSLGQAATAAFRDQHGEDWRAFADEILVAQGRASAMGGQGTAVFVVPVLDGLAEHFANGDGVLLDVGVGVAELACAFCQAVPGARVVGIDPLPRAIELAAAPVASHGPAGRVQLRCQGVEELNGRGCVRLGLAPVAVRTAHCRPRGLAARAAGPATRRVAVAARRRCRARSQW